MGTFRFNYSLLLLLVGQVSHFHVDIALAPHNGVAGHALTWLMQSAQQGICEVPG